MKKIYAAVLGGALALGGAPPAGAASQIDFSGYYRLMFMSETNTGHGDEPRSFTDSYFQDRLNFDVSFRPTDELAVHWRFRDLDGGYQRWGSGERALDTRYVYGEIKQDWGRILIGRLSDDLDVYGLASLGYQPENIPVYTRVGPFDRADILDGLRYTRAWDGGFSLLVQYGKLDNNGQVGGLENYWPITDNKDLDYDRYQIQGAYAWDGGGLSLNIFYDRDATGMGRHGSYGWGRQGDYHQLAYFNRLGSYQPPPRQYVNGQMNNGRLHMVNIIQYWGLNPSIMHSWGDFSLHFEGMAIWGAAQFEVWSAEEQLRYDQRGDGYGAYLDLDYNYGPGHLTLAGWWVSGTDLSRNPDDLRGKSRSLADLAGGNFYPLLVAYNGMNLNPGGHRYQGNGGQDFSVDYNGLYHDQGYLGRRNVSAVGFANNGYENYVYEGHVGRVNDNTDLSGGYNQFDTISYRSLNGIELNTGSESTNLGGGESVITKAGLFVNQVLRSDRTRSTSFNNDSNANHWAVALTGSHAFNADISVHYGLAYLGLNKPNYRVAQSATYDAAADSWSVGGYRAQAKDLGFEADLGLSLRLLDNLSFTSAFGYMFNGDAYQSLRGYTVTDAAAGQLNISDAGGGRNVSAVWDDPDDSYVWFNSLTVSF